MLAGWSHITYTSIWGVIKIRKVELTMNEEKKYEIIKKLVETNGNKAASQLLLSPDP